VPPGHAGVCETPQANGRNAGQNPSAVLAIMRGTPKMTHWAECASPAGGSSLEPSAAARSLKHVRNTNIGYVLFAFGALWIMAIVGMLAAAPK